VQANFNPSRQLTPAALSSPLASGDNVFNLMTAQVLVSYTFDTWGLNRRTVAAQRHPAAS
jgi:outer membrane protein TolC